MGCGTYSSHWSQSKYRVVTTSGGSVGTITTTDATISSITSIIVSRTSRTQAKSDPPALWSRELRRRR